MKKKRYFTLLVIATIAASLAVMSAPVTAGDNDVTFDLTMYYFATSGIYQGVDPDLWVMVNVFVDASALPDGTGEGMMGWGLYVTVDPDVLTPVTGYAGGAGYFLYEWSLAKYGTTAPFPGAPLKYPPTFLASNGTDFIECSEYFLNVPAGAGGVGAYPLCTLYFVSKSKTAYTEITVDYEKSGYQEHATGTRYRAVVIDGHYNMPPNGYLFEQFTGSTWPVGNPIGSDWHELEPMLCETWSLESWIDNDDGKLTPSDQIDMIRASDESLHDFHVEWVNPYGTAGDGVADLFVTEKPIVPEFPLGSVAPIALIAAVAYIWWVTRRKRQEAV